MLTILTDAVVNEVFNSVLTALITGLGAILTAAIGYGLARLGKWLKSKTNNEKLQSIIDHTLGFTEDVVITINQTYVDELKDKDLFDKAAQKEAFNRAFNNAKSMITEEAQEIINENFGDLDTWLEALIESKVAEVKELLKP